MQGGGMTDSDGQIVCAMAGKETPKTGVAVFSGLQDGGGNRGRTGDLRLMSPPLYRLSYPAEEIRGRI